MPSPADTAVVLTLRQRLAQPGQSMSSIASTTGVSKRWLEMFRSGDIPKPGLENLLAVATHYGFTIELKRERKAA